MSFAGVVTLRPVSSAAPVERVFSGALTGAIDGVNDTFSAPAPFVAAGARREAVLYNGVRLAAGAGADYLALESIPGAGFDTIRLAFAPKSGDTLTIDYDPA